MIPNPIEYLADQKDEECFRVILDRSYSVVRSKSVEIAKEVKRSDGW